MHQITLNGRECLVIEVEDYVSAVKTKLKISGLGYLCHFSDATVLETWHPIGNPAIRLPTGPYEILLRSWDMTEGEASTTVERCFDWGTGYRDYSAPTNTGYCGQPCLPTALQSAQSLFTHLGYKHCVVVGKLPNP